jgi:ribonuclease P protein component
VRREGTSYAHPFIVLVAHPNESTILRIGVAAGKSMGSAVDRNRAKRRTREAIRPLIPYILTGWDLLFLARRSQQEADFQHLQAAVQNVLNRAKLLKTF